ncbi:Response regulator [Marinomonas sp. MED121]|uniref:response regulator n=1 Tax=Marinomonas sp. MED121 TaxID=314277 RepID=UPI0000690240|nr:response regulator [Marinomonas sp. MED121]EAQ63461.1 Response regulator [Marinomonas sp. MED121]
MKVLIIDDSHAVQLIIKRALEKGQLNNLETKLASSGIQALKILETWLPDLVLSDLHMPKMSGLEFLSEVNKQMFKLNVGLITTETDSNRLNLAKKSGVKFIVNKPFQDAEIIQHAKSYQPFKDSKKAQIAKPVKVEPEEQKNNLAFPNESTLEDALAEAFFRDVKVKIKPYEKYEEHHYPYLLGMMTEKEKEQINAICILKQPAIKQVSKAFSSLHPGAMNTSQDRANMCNHFFKLLESHIKSVDTNESILFKKSNLINKPFPRISEFYEVRGDKKVDFFIEIKGFDAFVITLVAA